MKPLFEFTYEELHEANYDCCCIKGCLQSACNISVYDLSELTNVFCSTPRQLWSHIDLSLAQEEIEFIVN